MGKERMPFTQEQVNKLIKAYHGRLKNRNIAMIMLGCETGFRIGELLTTKRKDIIDEDGLIRDELTLVLSKIKNKDKKKKPNEYRTVELNEIAKHYLKIWLNDMEGLGFRTADKHVFCKINGGKLGRVGAWKIVKDGCRRAGIKGKTGTHSLRKTFAENIAADTDKKNKMFGENKNSTKMAQIALGHKSIASTEKYLQFRNYKPKEAILSRTLDLIK